MNLFPNEKLDFTHIETTDAEQMSNEDINLKYVKGELRIVTQQARYPLTAIVQMVESDKYELNPEFQRRHRWNDEKKSRLIESFIMNVPIPPIFLYEYNFGHYEVMDGLQRLMAIYEFYKNRLALKGLEEWPELNGRRYSELPKVIKRGIDRRYLSSIILLQETAKDEYQTRKLKRLIFARINRGGVKLEPQEARNAIYDGPLNQLCIKLSRNPYLCRTWGIPEPTETELTTGEVSGELLNNEHYQKMDDVERVLRFFAYRQKLIRSGGISEGYLDRFLYYGNNLPKDVLKKFEHLFTRTIKLVYDVFTENAFRLWRFRQNRWDWRRRSRTVYDPMMFAFSQHLDDSKKIIQHRGEFQNRLRKLYEENVAIFGRYATTDSKTIEIRNKLFMRMVADGIEAKL
jgi:hypothetical protein